MQSAGLRLWENMQAIEAERRFMASCVMCTEPLHARKSKRIRKLRKAEVTTFILKKETANFSNGTLMWFNPELRKLCGVRCLSDCEMKIRICQRRETLFFISKQTYTTSIGCFQS